MPRDLQPVIAIKDGKVYPMPSTREPVLYKYFGPPAGDRTFAQSNLENLIVNNQVRLSSALEVNDPADTNPYFDDECHLKCKPIHNRALYW